MDIITLAAWGEFLGGIAVVVSLIYLASQIRMNTKTGRASSHGDQLAGAADWNRMIVDPDIASLYVRGMKDFVGLSAEDQVRFNGLMGHLFGQSFRVRHLRQQGLNDASSEAEDEHTVSYVLESPGARQWWTVNRHWWGDLEFREFVDGLVRKSEEAG